MTRRKTKPEEIRNPDHYFKKYIAMEIKHDQIETDEYHRMFLSTDAILEGGEDGVSRDRLLTLSINAKGELFEKTQPPKHRRSGLCRCKADLFNRLCVSCHIVNRTFCTTDIIMRRTKRSPLRCWASPSRVFRDWKREQKKKSEIFLRKVVKSSDFIPFPIEGQNPLTAL